MSKQNSTSNHKTVSTLQINYCIVEHVKKTTCVSMREKPHVLGQLPSPRIRIVTVTDRLRVYRPRPGFNTHVHVNRDGYTYMDIPHTIIWRSVVLQTIPKPEINRPKLVKLLLSTKYIESIYEF